MNSTEHEGENPYKILGIKPNATDAQIKAAFRKQSKLHHPDKHAQEGEIERNAHEQQFKRAAWAYELLSDANERAYYDKHKRERKVRTGETEITPVEREIMQAFGQIFNPAKQDVLKTDYIQLIRRVVSDAHTQEFTQLGEMRRALTQVEKMLGRFVRADDEPGEKNLMEVMLQSQIDSLKSTIENSEKHCDHLIATIQEINLWRYTVEEGLYRGPRMSLSDELNLAAKERGITFSLGGGFHG